MSHPITITIQLEDAFLADILTTACEGGIAYWADTQHYQETDGAAQSIDVRACGGPAFEEGDPRNGWKKIDHAALFSALERCLIYPNSVAVSGRIIDTLTHAVSMQDAGQIDAEAADVLTQIAAFGEIVFG